MREKATRELARLGEVAGPALRKALALDPSPEVRRRAKGLLRPLKVGTKAGDELRVLRAVTALEHAGTPGAGRVLESLAGGDPRASLTQQAIGALGRLGR